MEFEGLEEKFHQILGRHKFQTLLFSSLILLVFEFVYVITSWITFRQDWLPVLVTSLGLVTCSVLSVITAVYRFYRRCAAILSLILWSASLGSMVLLSIIHTDTLYGYVYLLMYVTFVVYTLLPVHLWLSIVLGLITCILSLVLIYFAANDQVKIGVFQVLFLTGTLACINGLGVAYRILQQKYISLAFGATKNCVESRIKLEHERQQQEQLLLSVMPAHLAEEMKTKMLNKLRKPKGKNGELTRRKSAYGRFQDLYIRVYDNVSILYADIVNFTPLASSCSPAELVSLLNELFGRFDKLAHSHNCTRIKFLGDCYYCVSGIPDAHPKHANNCVQMALDMLGVIKEIRSLTRSTIDMRIGIHTGVVLSGVLGLKKWQYDVWSDDVVIANCLESSGVPGMIHISRSTLNELDDTYQVTAANQNRNQILVSKEVETFLIQTSESDNREKKVIERMESKVCLDTMQQLLVSPINIASFLTSCAEPKPFAETSCEERIVDTSVQQVEKSLQIFKRTMLIFPQCIEVEGIHWTALTNLHNEVSQWNRKDKYFTQSCIVACGINAFISVMGLCVQTAGSITIPLLATMAAVFIVLGIFLFASLYFKDFKLIKIKKFKCSIKVRLKVYFRIGLFVLILLGYFFLSCVFLTCEIPTQRNSTDNRTLDISVPSGKSGWGFVFCDVVFIIGMASTVLYQQLSYIVKLPLVLLLVLVHLVLLFTTRGQDCDIDNWLVSDSCITCFMTVIVLFMILRQSEVTWKLGLLWQQKFGVEKQEVETFGSLNKLLLENVLPFHVADHFLNTARGRSEELYHESYEKICVIFASIPNFWEYYEQSAVTKHGIECLRILNEIICDFDQLLSKPKYSSVEKIKTIGSTYMAASGVHRGRSRKKGGSTTTHSTTHCTVVMAEFAQALFEVLETLNKNSFTQFKLRIGINSGPAVAGVIGANKPQYDIWGDTVNVASRMESTGVMDKIHCTQTTADDLIQAGFTCECRGEIKVKGKQHPMVTYLIVNKHVTTTEGESR